MGLGKKPPAVTPGLRSMLESLERPAILLAKDYRILAANRAYQRHYGKRPAEGHDRCFAVSHGYDSPCDENGEDCPLRTALETRRNARVFHVHHHPEGPEHVDVELRPILDGDGEIEFFVELIAPIEQASAQATGSFVGRSRAFGETLGLIRRGAPSDVPILLLGESGTGKELAARAVHDASRRAGGPFVPVECSGLGEALFESELFGHAKGAFTGAHARKPGLVEAATGGTLFLDEIGDVPLSLQVKLLRLLESGTYRPVGDVEARRADFRLVCATHRDLDAMVEAGAFRQDLYYRINAFPVPLPALRERPEDLPLLCEALLHGSGKELGPEALRALGRYGFPGNVRELRNILERAVLLTDGERIEVEQLPPHVREAAAVAPPEAEGAWPWGDGLLPLDEVERRYLRWASEEHEGDRRSLADALGLSERTLYRKLREAKE
ncbi:MAG TPA: sigma-54-dependent Fis family transcriptional regulator [Polyangiaceae bacterium LLY-WYZ-15_(1-7)]|nr:sigma-54-dependent Fis family transcriptional regulator [Polyangiaceae bacterium LLY-WYZ-15_(1-7)]HJL12286.1 sigma-54-dependent Fis family transcriptional regulator [Polyangiaceae bacterium LLY-WYZ-15_(1-7)]